jgi:hypothetical protein
MEAKPISKPMRKAAHSHLRTCVLATNGRHQSASVNQRLALSRQFLKRHRLQIEEQSGVLSLILTSTERRYSQFANPPRLFWADCLDQPPNFISPIAGRSEITPRLFL